MVSTAAPENSPADRARTCVFCGAIAVHVGGGHVEWVGTLATPADCEHETLYGQD
jgi:hypothetical protein